MTLPTAKQRLHGFCNAINFATMSPELIQRYEAISFTIPLQYLTDDFVLGTQEFANAIATLYIMNGKQRDVVDITAIASAILFVWWKVNIRDSEFTEKEIEV